MRQVGVVFVFMTIQSIVDTGICKTCPMRVIEPFSSAFAMRIPLCVICGFVQDENWWLGICNGSVGYVPHNFVKPLPDNDPVKGKAIPIPVGFQAGHLAKPPAPGAYIDPYLCETFVVILSYFPHPIFRCGSMLTMTVTVSLCA